MFRCEFRILHAASACGYEPVLHADRDARPTSFPVATVALRHTDVESRHSTTAKFHDQNREFGGISRKNRVDADGTAIAITQ
jgi:hypothetical protein